MNNAFTRIVLFDQPLLEAEVNNIDWVALYPFHDDDIDTSVEVVAVNVVKEINKIDNFKNRVFSLEKKIEMYTKDVLICRMNFLESAVRYEKLIGWNLLNGDVYDLGDGLLTELVKENRNSTQPTMAIQVCLISGNDTHPTVSISPSAHR
ncbi:hypothetical protein FACS189493_0450 [Spirochaetia bacterium]|nr:hypothetical protein FACS189493_0450 [Spirochaetia bacterium]